MEFVPALQGREISLHGFDLGAELAELLRGLLDFGLVGRDEKVEAVFGTNSRKFIADSGRRAGHDRKLA